MNSNLYKYITSAFLLLIGFVCFSTSHAKPSGGGHKHTFSQSKNVICIGEQITVQDTCVHDPFQPVARLWTFSQGANPSSVSNQTQASSSFSSPGLKMITLSVFDIFNVGYTDTAYVLVQGSIADAGASKIYCSNTAGVFIGSGDTTQANIVWKDHSNLIVGSTRIISVAPTASGYFYLTVSKNNCITQDSVFVQTSAPPTANAGINQTVCNQNAVQIGAPAQPNLSYLWFPSAGLSDTSVAQPTANPSLSTIYTLFVTDANQCTGNAQVTVNVVNNLIANPGNNVSICQGDSIQLGSPQKSGWTYTWTPKNNINSASLAQPLVYPKNTTTYQLKVSAYGCYDSSSVQVIVKPLPLVDLQNKYLYTICKNDSVQINISPVTGYHYSWTPTLGVSAPSSTYTYLYPTKDTWYTLKVTGTNNCTAKDSLLVDLFDSLKAYAGLDQSICLGNSIILGAQLQVASGGSGNYTYQWQPAASLNNTSLAHPTAQPTSSTRYFVTVTDPISPKCGSATDSIDITIYPLPSFQLNFKKIFCKGDPAEQLNALPFGGQFTLVINNNLQPINNGLFDPNDTAIHVGVPYLIRYQYTTPQGCIYDTAVSILVKNRPQVDAGDNLFYCPARGYYNHQLQGFGTGIASWQPSNLLNNDSTFNPIITTTQTQNFILTINNGGCSASDSVAFVVCSDSVYLIANYDRLNTQINTTRQILIETNDSSSINKYLNSQFLIDRPCQHGLGYITQRNNSIEFSYTPSLNFVGRDTAIYILRDTFNLRTYEDTALILINVYPIAVKDSFSTIGGDLNCNDSLFTVTSNDSFDIQSPATIELIGNGLHGSFSVNGLNIIYHTTSKVLEDKITYILRQNGLSDTASLFVAYNCPACPCKLPDGFSPNNDGKNDFLDLLQTNNCIPDCSLIIYNRWGNVVYRTDHYESKWDGKYDGKDLPDGTYYYLISNTDKESKSTAGFLILQR